MITFYTDSTNKIRLKATNPSDFHGMIKICRKFQLKFDSETKTYIVPPAKFGGLYEDLSNFDEIIGYPEVSKFIKTNFVPVSDIKFNRRVFDPSLLRVPAIKGKHPNEDYQLVDAQRMFNRNRYGLFNEQGTGKTFCTIAALNHIWRDEGMLRTLIITSGSGVYTFYKELEKFAVGLDMNRVAIGGKNNRSPFSPDVDIVICSYRSFLLISDYYYKQTQNKDFVSKNYRKACIPFKEWIGSKPGVLILDESHYVANMQARQTKVIHLHTPFFYYRYLLSGTPADKPEKWYSQLKIIDPALVKGMDYWTWASDVAVVGNRFSNYVIQSFKPEKLKEMNTSIMQISSRRFVDDCLELPEHYTKKIYIPLNKTHRDIYEGFIEYYLDTMIKSGDGGVRTRDALMQFQHMILSVDNPELLKEHYILDESLEKKINSFSFKKDHSKIGPLLDLIEEHKEEQIVVWNSHPSVSDFLETVLNEHKITTGKIHGRCIPKKMDSNEFKQSVVEQFKQNKFQILLASSQMLTTSVTMTNACIQIFYDRTFDYVEFAQVRCRIYRIGQTRPVYTYIMIADKTIDITRDRRLEDKNFFDREFLSQEYVSKAMARAMFNPK